MLAKRIIPCLDIKNNEVVKGINFKNIKKIGNPVKYAIMYNKQGADEICILDISATNEKRKIIINIITKIAKNIFVPLTVGGGIHSINDFRKILRAGADKISINSAAVKNPDIINKASIVFGSQCVVTAIDAKKNKNNKFDVMINAGKINTKLDVVKWAKKCQILGAGEILLTSINTDGCCNGYDINLINDVCNVVSIPVIASGGCGKLEHFLEVFKNSKASAALVASLFHTKKLNIKQVKEYLKKNKISIR